MVQVTLPKDDGSMENYELSEPKEFEITKPGTMPRIAYSAAHVVADPYRDCNPLLDTAIDWDATIEYLSLIHI